MRPRTTALCRPPASSSSRRRADVPKTSRGAAQAAPAHIIHRTVLRIAVGASVVIRIVKLLHRQHHLDRVAVIRSEEHTSELQSLTNLVCRLLLEKKKNTNNSDTNWKKYNITALPSSQSC